MEAVQKIFTDLNIDWLYPLAISLSHIALVFAFSSVLRLINGKVLPKTVRPYVSEVICLYQLAACVFENGIIIAPEYGVTAFATLLFFLVVGYGLTFDGHGNPCGILNDYLEKKTSLLSAVIKIACSVLGAFLALVHLKTVWSLGVLDAHRQIIQGLDKQCPSTMQTTLALGMVHEFAASLIIRLQAGFLFGGKDVGGLIIAFLVVALTLVGAQYTGMFFNPALATAFTFNCAGHPAYEHALVYWLAPLLATVLAFFIVKYFKKSPKQQQRTANKKSKSNTKVQGLQKNGPVKDGKRKGEGKDGKGKGEGKKLQKNGPVKDGKGKGEGKNGPVKDGKGKAEGKNGPVKAGKGKGEGKNGPVKDGKGKNGPVKDGKGKGEGKNGPVKDGKVKGEGKNGPVKDGKGKNGPVKDGKGKGEGKGLQKNKPVKEGKGEGKARKRY